MKNTFLLLAISLGLISNVIAQASFSLNFVDTSQISGINNTVDIYGTLTNNTLTPLQMSMELFNLNIPNDWNMTICDAEQCHPMGTTSSVFTMSSNKAVLTSVYFSVGNTAAIGTANLRMKNLNTSETSIWTFTVNATTTSIVNYSMKERKPILTEWFTLQGQLIDDIEKVPNGIYIERLSFEKGAPLSSKVYINKH